MSRSKLEKNGPIIGIKYIHFNYINSLKESHVLRMGSGNEILAQMKKSEQEKLLEGIQKHNYELFWEINQPLNDKHIADMRKYAIRIYSNVYSNFVQPNYEIVMFDGTEEEQFEEGNQKFQAWEQSNYDLTLGDFLLKSFPSLFEFELDDDDDGGDGGKVTCKK